MESHTLEAFGLSGTGVALSGGTRPVIRIGDTVLKHIHDTSLENNGSAELVQWIAAIFDHLDGDGYRVPRPRPTRQGTWITHDGWTAWSFLTGRHAEAADIPACLEAIVAFHRALRDVPKHPLLDASSTLWAIAHRACLGDPPAFVHPIVRPLLDHLYALRRPVGDVAYQLIHGDLNPGNILIDPLAPPGFLDMSPFWGPVELAIAIFANFIGPRCGDAAVLQQFAGIRHFDQMLVRAGIRMLIVVSAHGDGGFEDWDQAPEHDAARIIIRHAERQQLGNVP